jgi:hypothetical protein
VEKYDGQYSAPTASIISTDTTASYCRPGWVVVTAR